MSKAFPIGTQVTIISGPLKGMRGTVLSRQGGFLGVERKYILQFPGGRISRPIREKYLTGA